MKTVILEKLKDIALSNKDITRYGDGFEKAIHLAMDSVKNTEDILLDDYKRRLETISIQINSFKDNCPSNPDYARLKTKASCYRTIISELERINNC